MNQTEIKEHTNQRENQKKRKKKNKNDNKINNNINEVTGNSQSKKNTNYEINNGRKFGLKDKRIKEERRARCRATTTRNKQTKYYDPMKNMKKSAYNT